MARPFGAMHDRAMNERLQLAELRANRDLYVRYLADWEARQAAPAAVGGGLPDIVLRSLDRLQGVVADLERAIAQLEAGKSTQS